MPQRDRSLIRPDLHEFPNRLAVITHRPTLDLFAWGVFLSLRFAKCNKRLSNRSINGFLRQLVDLSELAESYAGLTEMDIGRLLDIKEFVEISHE